MISILMHSQQSSGICMATIIFYTCILIPLRQIKQALFSIIVLLIGRGTSSRLEPVETGYCCSRRRSRQQPLPVACRFEKVQKKDESCSICLVEMEEEDAVSQLSRCMHVFHMDCIDKWIQRDHFTCPLCRTSIDDDDD
ncbi:RING-H2 finger protein [Salix suchowensis]|nr:RING-H2 finger protein [Salix suchowensis]